MIDRADRWHAGCQSFSKLAESLQEAIEVTWLQIFGPFVTLVIDGEKGIDSASTRAFLKRHGIELEIRAKGQHARMIERRGAVLRHSMHTTWSQLTKENITITFKQLLAQCLFAGNALTNIGGGTPYNARLGSQPAMLPDLMALQDTNEPLIQINNRIRQVSLEKIITATAIARSVEYNHDALRRGNRVSTG